MEKELDNKFGEKMLRKARHMAAEVFFEYYNKTEEERNTSELIDTKIVNMMSKCFLLGVKSYVSEVQQYLDINDTIKKYFP